MAVIADQGSFDRLIGDLRNAPEIAIDTEADSLHSYFDKVCLIQISAAGADHVVDPLAPIDISGLGTVLSDPAIRKILHGADYDIRILDRDYGIRVRNVADTMICAQLAGEPAVGLAALVEKYAGVALDKKHQRADWARRPLPAPMLRYATEDTAHLSKILGILQAKLVELGRWGWAVEEFERLEAISFSPVDEEEERWRRLKGSGKLDRLGLEILRSLHGWRDGLARERDVPAFKVIGNDALLSVAEKKPKTTGALIDEAKVPTRLARRYARPLLSAVRSAAEVAEADLPEKQKKKSWRRDRDVEKRIDALKKLRDSKAKSLGIEPGILAPRHVLEAVATAQPSSVDDLARIDNMRRWQIEVLGKELVKKQV